LLLLSLLISASIASSGWSAAAAAGVIEQDGVQVTILPTVAAGAGPGTSIEVALDVEAVTDDAARRLGFRSLRGVTTFDCQQGANLFREAVAYDQANLKGQGKARPTSGKWGQPAPGSLMAAVTLRVCGGSQAGTGPAAAVTAAPTSDATALSATASAASAVPPPRPAAPPPAAKPTPPNGAARPTASAVAQLAASPNAKGAQGVLNALRSLIAPPLAGTVEPATVHGTKVYRASVAGFGSTAEAKAFCAKAANLAKTCWVRQPPAA
jgi:hypothetical protein